MTPPASDDLRLLHLVGRLTDAVFSFVGPATDALAQSGYRQTVVMMEDPRASYLAGEFSDQVELIVIKDDSRWRRWSQAAPLVWRLLRQHRDASVHFHGILPLMFGGILYRLARCKGRLLYSPHGSRAHAHWPALGNALMAGGGWLLGSAKLATVAETGPRASASPSLPAHLAVRKVDSPVDDVFFAQQRLEVSPAVVVVCGQDDEEQAIALVCQLAAVFSGHPSAPAFKWLGTPKEATSIALLKAAGISVLPAGAFRDRAKLLSSATIFVAAAASRGFAVQLAEAMAAGVPCIAAACNSHRAMLDDGETGLIFESADEARHSVAAIVDDAAKRSALSSAAKSAALARHTKGQFNDSILRIYAERLSTDAAGQRIAQQDALGQVTRVE